MTPETPKEVEDKCTVTFEHADGRAFKVHFEDEGDGIRMHADFGPGGTAEHDGGVHGMVFNYLMSALTP